MEEFKKQNAKESNITRTIKSVALEIADTRIKEMEIEMKKHFQSQIDLIFCSSTPQSSTSSPSRQSSFNRNVSATSKSWAMRWKHWAESLRQQQQQHEQQLTGKINKLEEQHQKLASNIDKFEKLVEDKLNNYNTTTEILCTKIEKKIDEFQKGLDQQLVKNSEATLKKSNELAQENKVHLQRKIMEVQQKLDPKIASDLATIRVTIQGMQTQITKSDQKLMNNITENSSSVTQIKKRIKQQDEQMQVIKETACEQIRDLKENSNKCAQIEDQVEQLEDHLADIKRRIEHNGGEIDDIGAQTDAFLKHLTDLKDSLTKQITSESNHNQAEKEGISHRLVELQKSIQGQIEDQTQQIGDQKRHIDDQRQTLEQKLVQFKDFLTAQIHNETKDVEQLLTDQIEGQKQEFIQKLKDAEDDLNQLENQMLNQVLDNQKELKENIDQMQNVDLKKLGHLVYVLIRSYKICMRRSGSPADPFQTPQTAQTPQLEKSKLNPTKNTSQELISACYELLGRISPPKKSTSKLFT